MMKKNEKRRWYGTHLKKRQHSNFLYTPEPLTLRQWKKKKKNSGDGVLSLSNVVYRLQTHTQDTLYMDIVYCTVVSCISSE
jgi:hypothetical protein